MLSVAVILLLGNQFLWRKGLVRTTPSAASAQAKTEIPQKSIAVLPFANESGKPEERFFSDGLSEDLINALSQFDDMKVISRSSAFQFRDSNESSTAIGEKLGVAHLLEGAVQRLGDELRITATLVNAADGSILWSQRYDKPSKDLFALQDAITQAVADALKAKLPNGPGEVLQTDRPPSGNVDAYLAYQRGLAMIAVNSESSFHNAIDAFNEAIRLDPAYVAAYAQLSFEWVALAIEFEFGSAKAEHSIAEARKAAETALTLDPKSSLAHQARAYLLQQVDMDWTGAEAEAQRALQLAPYYSTAQYGLGQASASLGRNRNAVQLTRQAITSSPRNADWYSSLAVYLTALGQLEGARTSIQTAIELQPSAATYYEQVAVIEILRGNADAALAAAQKEPEGPWHDVAMALALQIGRDRTTADAALQKLANEHKGDAPYQIAQVYALRRDPENMFEWLDRAWSNRDPGVSSLLSDPLILRYQRDPRFAAFCKKAGLPTTTDAVAMK
ncbi:MAG: tetratricopeptide repeat protein [Rhodanobacteraceae bacterium]